ncbi:hypothetical protein E3N88_08915 [Mikania micrantha]|uniref:Uncharacterized protein n=1 Tax=Mikania micrantha TaxID=192012 RepID=A0A5N6PHL4_9ASTR|nr:hypothetical protein E3N88_08915 [Mikania micrantha]
MVAVDGVVLGRLEYVIRGGGREEDVGWLDMKPTVRVGRGRGFRVGKGRVGEDILHKLDMSGGVNFVCEGVDKMVSTLGRGVPNKDTRGRAGLEFMFVIGAKPRVGKAAKAAKLCVVWEGAEES